MSDDPTGRQIAKEVAIFVILTLVVGSAFVAARYARIGSRVFAVDPHDGSFDSDEAFEIRGSTSPAPRTGTPRGEGPAKPR